MISNLNDHSLITGVGYNAGFIDIKLQYSTSLNQEDGNGYTDITHYGSPSNDTKYPDKAHSLNTIKIIGTIPLWSKSKNK